MCRWVSCCPASQLQVSVFGLVRLVVQLRFCGASGGSMGKAKKVRRLHHGQIQVILDTLILFLISKSFSFRC